MQSARFVLPTPSWEAKSERCYCYENMIRYPKHQPGHRRSNPSTGRCHQRQWHMNGSDIRLHQNLHIKICGHYSSYCTTGNHKYVSRKAVNHDSRIWLWKTSVSKLTKSFEDCPKQGLQQVEFQKYSEQTNLTWPNEFKPQQTTPPPQVTAHVWSPCQESIKVRSDAWEPNKNLRQNENKHQQ